MPFFQFFLFKAQIGSDALEVGVGEFGQSAEVVDGGEAELLAAEVIDGFRLLVTQVGMALQSAYIAAVDAKRRDVFSVRSKVGQECV